MSLLSLAVWITLGCTTTSRPAPPAPGTAWDHPLVGPLLWVPGGTFAMGSPMDEEGRLADEGPVHPVTLRGTWVMRAEASQALYELVTSENPSGWNPCPSCPVDRVSWFGAVAFANGLSDIEGLDPAYDIDGVNVTRNREADGYRLLTEAEWEHAARGGQTFRHAGSDDAGAVGWVQRNSGGAPHPSCDKPPNSYGLCDMTGNHREWVWDRHGPYDEAAQVDPTGHPTNTWRVLRGGSWNSPDAEARVAYRFPQVPTYRSMSVSFRLARPTDDRRP
ncbi:MAG: formylglycine-generating enzyme family protein [Myxococcota bacterium]